MELQQHRHTYLFESAKWNAIGTYYDEASTPISVSGQSIVTVESKKWKLEGSMILSLDNSNPEISNTYLIEPFKEGKDYTSWISENPALGKLEGFFVIVNDTILSQYRSVDGIYSGSEILLFIDDDQYQNWGAAFEKNKKMSSWEVMLERVS